MKPIALALAVAVPAVAGAIETREVRYEAGTVTARGFLATPDGDGPHPGVLVVHEWWGHNDYARKRARMLAELGYAALALDMFGDGRTADHPRDASAFVTQIRNNSPELAKRFLAAMKFLRNQPETDRDRIAAIGYCFGGNVVLQMARNGLRGLDGVASFHGSLDLRDPNPPVDRITARILVCNGGGDPFIKPESIAAFKASMAGLGADLKIVNYKDVLHGFTNPDATAMGRKFNIPLKYDGPADRASWKELKEFLRNLWSDDPDSTPPESLKSRPRGAPTA